MDRLRALEVFVAVVDAGSFAEAGRRLNMSPPAVTRAVAALEDRLGARLLTRTTRSLSQTEAGQRFVEHARRLIADFSAAEEEITGRASMPIGHLRIAASATFGRLALTPVTADFLSAHPRVTASLTLLDRVVNLVEEGLDVGVRLGELPESNLIARRIGGARRVLVGSPDYLLKHGTPPTPEALSSHKVIGFSGLMPDRKLLLSIDGKAVKVPVEPHIEVNDAAAALIAAENGHGLAYLYAYMAGASIRAGRLRPVLEEHWATPEPVNIIYPDSRLLAAKVRAFVDWTAPRLSERLAELSAH